MSVLVQIYLAIGVVAAIILVAVLAEGALTPLGRPGEPGRRDRRSAGPHRGDVSTSWRPAAEEGESVGRAPEPSPRPRNAGRGRDATGIAWMAEAACREVAPEPFFSTDRGDVRLAKQLCARCDVRAACLEHALDERLEHGIWGGATAHERRRKRPSRRRAGTVEPLARRTIERWFPLTRR